MWASRVLPDIWNRFSLDGPRFTAIAAKYLRRLIGARELIYDEVRHCLWLVGAAPGDIRTSPVLAERMAAVRAFRENSTEAKTKEDANRPSEFQEVRQPDVDYLAVPLHTSEDRDYAPIARFTRDVITNNAVSTVGDPSLTTFGLLQSRIFNVWGKAVSGRIKSDPRISGGITYNNFPFPTPNSKGRETIEKTAEEVLAARDAHLSSSLADLYDRNSMPADLRAAHTKLDRAILKAYELTNNASDEQILTKLFGDYASLTRGLLDSEPLRRTKKARRANPAS